eukprot:9392153-Alexandrium_andersonii.AAC.1
MTAQITDWRIAVWSERPWRFRERPPPSSLAFVGRFGTSAENCTDCTSRELHGPKRHSIPERLKQLCVV